MRSGSLWVWGAKSQGAASLGRCPCGVAEGRMEAPLMPVLAWAVPKALLGVRESRGGERGLHGGLGWDLAVGGTPPNLLPDSSVTTAESTVLGAEMARARAPAASEGLSPQNTGPGAGAQSPESRRATCHPPRRGAPCDRPQGPRGREVPGSGTGGRVPVPRGLWAPGRLPGKGLQGHLAPHLAFTGQMGPAPVRPLGPVLISAQGSRGARGARPLC